ncbi:hypothetical protein SAMN05444405_1061 [Bacteroides luti]|uniref:Uncharacterized protein n=1 Tax=Bacteroides luti TaxID=1297750 RepID=A0A1M4ZNG6_9BACE|nr:hypothetical protein SAMN05444405_1061 [Bacteroides luti]
MKYYLIAIASIIFGVWSTRSTYKDEKRFVNHRFAVSYIMHFRGYLACIVAIIVGVLMLLALLGCFS